MDYFMFWERISKKEKYTNPYKKCVIDAKSSKLKGSCQISSYIGMQHDEAYCITVHNKQSFVEVDLEDKYLIATDYTLRNYTNGDYYWITGWNLEGSNDGKQWNVIDEKKRCNELRGKGKVCHFEIKQKPLCFRIFRIRTTETLNDQKSWQLCLSGFELYGFLLQEAK